MGLCFRYNFVIMTTIQSNTSKSKQNFALITVCLAALMFSFEISSVPVALSAIEKQLKGNFSDLQWIMNAYTIACCTVLMASGTLADKYGRKRLFCYNLVLFCITSLVCGFAGSMYLLIIARFLQGMSGGAMFICAIANLSTQFPNTKGRAKAFSVWGVIVGVGLGFGPVIGSAIMSVADWRWIFLVHVPLALITVLLANWSIIESRDGNAKRLDIAGIVFMALAVFALTFYIIQGPAEGFVSLKMLVWLILAVLSLGIFLVVELKSSYPMFDFSVFRNNRFTGAIMGSIGMNFSFWPFIIYLPLLFEIGFGYSTLFTGVCLLAYTLPSLVMPPLAENLTIRFGAGWIIPIGLFLIGAGFLWMRYGTAVEHAGWQSLLGGMLISGIGLGLTNTPVTNTATSEVSRDRVGMASGIDTSARLITLAINIALMGLVLISGITSGMQKLMPNQNIGVVRKIAEQLNSVENMVKLDLQFSKTQLSLVITDAFSDVLLFGGLGVWALALLSFIFFGAKSK